MSTWVIGSGGTAVNAAAIVEVIVARTDDAVEVRASLAASRPGPYRVVASFGDTSSEGALDALDCRDALLLLLAAGEAGVLQWDDTDGWCVLADPADVPPEPEVD